MLLECYACLSIIETVFWDRNMDMLWCFILGIVYGVLLWSFGGALLLFVVSGLYLYLIYGMMIIDCQLGPLLTGQ